LIGALKDKEPGPRAAAAEALGLLQADPEEIVPALVDALNDADGTVRLYTIMSLGRYGEKAHRAVAALATIVTKDNVVDVRRKAAEALGQVGAAAKSAAPALVEALQKDKDKDVRRWAAIALTKIGADAREEVPTLVKVLAEVLEKEQDRFVRSNVVHALGKLGKDAVEPLKKCLQTDVVIEVRLAAIEELGMIGPDAKDDVVIRLLTTATRDGRSAVREAAETALKKIQK
jgi:HEAT repeat protein